MLYVSITYWEDDDWGQHFCGCMKTFSSQDAVDQYVSDLEAMGCYGFDVTYCGENWVD